MTEVHRARASHAGRGWHHAATLAVIAGLGCVDFDAPIAPDSGLPDEVVIHPSFATHIQPIFTARCATSSCHTLATHQGGLVLEPGHAYDSLVGVSARVMPGKLRVKPGDPGESILMAALSDTADRVGLPRMPLGLAPLTANQIATIANWITDGAPDN